ncbi:class F sortase [Natribacillus halophilus]|uniref:Sortase (Surface protein transpeptidase) n=1 Tax=Natribacillus halophilus TaxID=549003 RepID=A0A1G8KWZ5_9BACI|nr:sortase [Natribacillus halophilus]SDI47883.1 Sortase (surface protein transpeptidase) [Natribacillus halophilus]
MSIQLKKKILMLLSMSLLVLLPMGFQMGIFPFVDAEEEEEWGEDNQGERIDISTELEGTLSEEFNRLDATASDSQQPDQNNEGITPASIDIPAIDVETDIEEVGILDNGQMGVPSDEDGVAWFEPGTKPGATGNAVMAGHVDSYEGPAIFFDLEDLADGDEIIVSDEEGKALIFTVRTQESYPLGEAPMDDIFGSSGDTSHLNLITCAGTFNEEEGTHDERLVVYAELDEEKSDIEQEAPDAPTNVEVNDSFVSWHAVDNDDVAGYRVYRGELGDDKGEFEQVESVSVHERKRISDTAADPSEHSYYITSVDIHGQESEPSEKVSEE